MTKKQYCLVLDLNDDAQLIEEYERYHQPGNVWPEVLDSIRSSGIEDMRIYRHENKLTMFMLVNDTFSFEAKTQADQDNPKVQEWEALMDKFQKRLNNEPEVKWMLTDEIFSLSQHT